MSVRNPIALFLGLSTLAFFVACGGSSSRPTPNPVGFSTSSLNGTYVFSSSGVDFNGQFLTVAGALVANGSGGITGGTMDVVGFEVIPKTPIAQAVTGSYSVGPDGRGTAKISSSAGIFTLDFVLTSNLHGLVTEFDRNGTGSGTIDLQTAVTSQTQLQGPYAFSFFGLDGNGSTLATAGAFTLNPMGASIVAGTGVQDFNDAGIVYTDQTLTSVNPATLGSGTGPGSISFATTFGPLTFDFYPIDAMHLKFIETDYTEFLAGDVFSQTGASIPTGPMAFTMAGGVTAPIADGGLMTSDGTGNFTGGLEDVNDNGTVSVAQVPFSGLAAAGGSVGGRVVVNLTGFTPATQWVIYPSTGGLLMLETDAASVTLGAAYAQTSQTLAASQNYGFNLTGFNLSIGLEEDDIAQFTTTSSTFTGAADVNDDTNLIRDQALSGSYTLDSPATGRGEATTTNFVNYTFYVVDSSTVLLLETDSNQIGVGSFELQSAPGAPGTAQARIGMAHAAVRGHAALRSK